MVSAAAPTRPASIFNHEAPIVSLYRGNVTGAGYTLTNAAQIGALLESVVAAAASGTVVYLRADATTTAIVGKDGVRIEILPGVTWTTASDELIGDSNATKVFGVYGGGTLVSTTDGVALLYNDADDTEMVLECDKIHHQSTAANSPALRLGGNNRIRVRNVIQADGYDAVWIESGINHLDCPRLQGLMTNNGVNNGNAIEFSGGTGYINVDHMTSFGPVMQVQVVVASTVFHINCQHMEAVYDSEDEDSDGIVLQIDASTIGGFNGVINCPRMTGRIVHTATGIGTKYLRIVGARIDASAIEAIALTLNGAGVVLEDCTIVMKASQTYAITASAAQTLTVIGDLTITDETGADRTSAVHSNVTITRIAKRDLLVRDGGTGVSTLTGIVKGNGTSAFSAAAQGTDYYAPGGTDVAVVDGGTGASTAAAARTNLAIAANHPTVLYHNGNLNASNTGTSPGTVLTVPITENALAIGDSIKLELRVDRTAGSGNMTVRAKLDGSIVTGNISVTSPDTDSELFIQTIEVTGSSAQRGVSQKLGVNSTASNTASSDITGAISLTVEVLSNDGATTIRLMSATVLHYKVKTS